MIKVGNVVLVNPSDRSWTRGRFVLAFGQTGTVRLMVWSNSLDDALDEAIDWLAEHAPGILADDVVAECYAENIEAGHSDEKAHELAVRDMTCGGNAGNYIPSWEWFILAENPSRDEVIELLRN